MSDTQFTPLPLPAELCTKIMYSGHIRHPVSDLIKSYWTKQHEVYCWHGMVERMPQGLVRARGRYFWLQMYDEFLQQGRIDRLKRAAKQRYKLNPTDPWCRDSGFPKSKVNINSILHYINYGDCSDSDDEM